ncbi:MAG: porin family protein [Alphaproteobacteria bacterium]|nr:porin family protein [Alphaproteobacteria bacterium]
MQKVLVALSMLAVVFSEVKAETEVSDDAGNELVELGEPCKYVSGAYYGLGLGLSHISHKINAVKNSTENVTCKRNSNQYDISLIGGFGSAFYKRYYAGIELELFKRLKGSDANKDDFSIVFPSTIGLNMDVRFGYQFPESGSLVYVTVGFARVIGKASFKVNNARRGRRNEVSFGSFYPTFGAGVEYKINHNWNVRGDVRYSITSKDDNKHMRVNNTDWKFDAKPSRVAFRISITRNIGTSFFR